MDRDTFISLAAYGVICGGLGLAITMAIRIWQHRPRKRPQRVYTTLQALDLVVAALEQDEALRREAALGNDVVRFRREIRPVREARKIIEREMAK